MENIVFNHATAMADRFMDAAVESVMNRIRSGELSDEIFDTLVAAHMNAAATAYLAWVIELASRGDLNYGKAGL